VNSEELEQSLRTEFESYLKDVFAGMRQEVTQFQEKINAELERHKSNLDEVFQDFSAQIQADKELDVNFRESVVEHLRLARDEGARITATAFAEAEAMQKESAEQEQATVPAGAGISELRDAINDISTKNTQSSILKALVQHAADFTPRGAFFIIKNEHLVGWRVFGQEGHSDEEAVREVFFPVAASTVLGEAVRSLSAVESAYGAYTDDSIYLNRFDFGQPEKMFAIPLVVRERTVAVLYADNGENGSQVNIEALETLARVASLTVEVLASGRAPKAEAEEPQAAQESASFDEKDEFESPTEAPAQEFEISPPVEEEEEQPAPFASEEQSFEPVSEYTAPSYEPVGADSFAPQDFEMSQPVPVEEFVSEPQEEFQPVEQDASWSGAADSVEVQQDDAQYYEPVVAEEVSKPQTSEYQFETTQSYEPAPFEEPQTEEVQSFPSPQDVYAAFEPQNGKAENYIAEPVEQSTPTVTAAQPARTRFSDRNVDLPIEVGEEERRLHNDARRFARLLVSEIKLYNEQKVKEGREASDLYERLREAIDRSREMYDKRVQPPVAARFDYFHYEIVNTLAEGDEHKLGASYPGARV
jgi:GAF domain